MSPIPAIVSRATSSLLRRDGASGPSIYAIVAIVVVVLVIFSVAAVGTFCIMRRRRRRSAQEDKWRGSFVPNNVKVIGGIYSRRPSMAPSTFSGSGSGASSPYKPTTDYGQYLPPIPKSIYNPNRSPSRVRPHNPANLVRHARDKSLPLLP